MLPSANNKEIKMLINCFRALFILLVSVALVLPHSSTSGTANVSWSGTLSSATFYVETTAGTDSFYIDDASFR
jgi:hypothetical protein